MNRIGAAVNELLDGVFQDVMVVMVMIRAAEEGWEVELQTQEEKINIENLLA
jgi:hypothetical protein